MTTLVEFLTARLDEEQRLAQAVDLSPDTHGIYQQRMQDGSYERVVPAAAEFYVMRVLRASEDGYPIDRSDEAATRLFKHNDPARVLADVAAKRRIIEWALLNAETIDHEFACSHTAEQIRRGECEHAELTPLHLLAEPYAGHEDFDPAWSAH